MLGSAVERGLKRLDAWIEIRLNAVTIASGPGDGPTPGLQLALQVPSRPLGSTPTTTREGDVLVVVGENFMESVMSTWCTTGSEIERAQVVSSAIARCVVSLGDPTHESTLSRSSHGGQLRVGVSSGEDTVGVESRDDLLGIGFRTSRS